VEQPAHPGRPARGRRIQGQQFADLVEQLEGIAALAVDLVDEGDDRYVAQPTDLEQLAGLGLDALGRVDHHDRGIDRGQGPVGILAEVLVARRVEQVEGDAAVFEGHHRGGHGDAARLLDLHPVGARAPALAARLDGARQMDGAAQKQQLLGQRRLAGIGMRDDGEGAAPGRRLARRAGRGVQEGRRQAGSPLKFAPWRTSGRPPGKTPIAGSR
jgi:hypothetical protein